MNNREIAKKKIQDILEKYKCGITMMPKLVPEGILITMDIIESQKNEDTNTNNTK